jgi:hypothetical protein
MTQEIHQYDIGTIFEVTVLEGETPVDLSSAAEKTMIFQKPDKTLLEVPGVLATDGTDGVLHYTTVEDDLDQIGSWKLQLFLAFPVGEWHTDIGKFKVYANLDEHEEEPTI